MRDKEDIEAEGAPIHLFTPNCRFIPTWCFCHVKGGVAFKTICVCVCVSDTQPINISIFTPFYHIILYWTANYSLESDNVYNLFIL